VKLPLAIPIFLTLAALAAALVPAARRPLADELFWIAPATVLLALMSAMTGLDLGVRYDLPILPFLFVGIARVAHPAALAWMGRAGRVAIGVALAWMVVGTLRVHPHELSYFNEIAGGPRGGARHLLDSNIDWGQDLLELRRVLDLNEPLGLAYFGAVDPALAGIRWRVPPRDPRTVPPGHALPSDTPTLLPGLYAISVNFLYGLPHRVPGPGGESVPSDEDAFAYFRTLRPFARAGYSIEIFRVGPEEADRIEQVWRRPLVR